MSMATDERVRRDGAWLVVTGTAGEIRILATDQSDLSGFVDVEVRSPDGRRFVATFGTIADVSAAMTRWKGSGECLSGRYFWIADLVLVEVADVATIVATVEDLAIHQELVGAFSEVLEDEARRGT